MKKFIVTLLLGIVIAPTLKVEAVDFNLAYYEAHNPDVVAAYGRDFDAIYDHYITYGIKEGRQGYNDTFDVTYYAGKYPDVVASVGNSYDALYNHYVSYGKKEGRFKNIDEELYGFPVYIKDEPKKETITTPVVLTENIVATPLDGYDTYVDVDLTNQIVTYFENGIAKLQSPCVTGNTKLKRGTPTGEYKIMTHKNGKYLKGPTWNCWVDYWMQFTPDAIGLHDASWRSSFGGEIYKNNGSHGCVNLPHDAASKLFELVGIGTTVVVH